MVLFTMYYEIVYMYCEHKGSIFIFLNRPLQESLHLEFVLSLIIFFFLILNILMLDVELPQKIIP